MKQRSAIKRILLEKKNELLNLAKMAGVFITLLTFLFGGVQWLDNRYVDIRGFQAYQKNLDDKRLMDEQRLVTVFEAMERERERDLIMLYRGIREAGSIALQVRRDVLVGRGRNNLNSAEQAELEIIERRLADILVQP
jgi:hypothetical protein